MPLQNIRNMPETAQQPAFDFSHYQDHLEIVQAINAQLGTGLSTYAIHPAIERDEAWRRLHQSFHNDMNKALALSSSQDLTGEMDKDWHWNNYQEHLAARTKLGI